MVSIWSVFYLSTLWLLLDFLSEETVLAVHEEDPSTFVLHCYQGSAVVLGDARDEGTECHPFLGFRQYCYKFVAETPTNTITELGCASLLCAGIRGTCADMEVGGFHGTMCCCNDRNYCNDASLNKIMADFLAENAVNLSVNRSLLSAMIIVIFQSILFYLIA